MIVAEVIAIKKNYKKLRLKYEKKYGIKRLKCFNMERLIKVNNMADVMPAACT